MGELTATVESFTGSTQVQAREMRAVGGQLSLDLIKELPAIDAHLKRKK